MIHVHRGIKLPDGLQSPDVYFTPAYGRAATVTDVGEWCLIEAFDGAWQMPLIVRTLVDGTKDAISPYGYSGVYAAPSLSQMQIHEAWSASVASLRDLGIISVLLRHSPLVPQASGLMGLRPIVRGHPTIVLEPIDHDSAWHGLEKRCRTKIRKALKNGYTGDVRQAESKDLLSGGDFRGLYDSTMDRLGAAPLYLFSDEYYLALLRGLGSDLLVAEVRNPLGVVASSSVLMRHGDRIHGHLAGSSLDDAPMGTNNLLKWITIEFVLDRELRQFHLGGGVSHGDNLFKFKRSFGGRELTYNVSGLVIDDDSYQNQVELRAKERGTTSDSLLTSGFFPAYRGGAE